MDRLFYREGRNLDHLDLISRYPSCFRAATDDFEDLVVHNIRALWRVR
jgi:hypothetical protein